MPSTARLAFDTTLHVRDHCLCFASQRAARALARRFDEVLKPIGITSGQFSLLQSLNRPHPPTIGSLADGMAMDRTTLTANLKPLERRGLVEIRPDASDRRSRRPALTAAGHAILLAAMPIWTETHAVIDRGLPDGGDRLRADLAVVAR